MDLLFVHNKEITILSSVGDPFLEQELRYHCPIYSVFKFSRPKLKFFKRQIWNYDRGYFALLRAKAVENDWDALRENNISTYATNITNHILSIATEGVPNKTARIRPSDVPWITSYIKR